MSTGIEGSEGHGEAYGGSVSTGIEGSEGCGEAYEGSVSTGIGGTMDKAVIMKDLRAPASRGARDTARYMIAL